MLVTLLLVCGTAGGYEMNQVLADDPNWFARFGEPVAIDGDWAVIGSGGTPSAYFFHYEAGTWVQHQRVYADDSQDGSNFGDAVAISGTMAVIGAHDYEITGMGACGAAFVFEFDGSNWTQTAVLAPDDGEVNDLFGEAVAIDGDVVVVGAYRDDVGDDDNAGSLYVYQNQGGSWPQVSHLSASDASSGANLGDQIAISGSVILAGAPAANPMGTNSGAAYAFAHDGSQWVDTQLVPADGDPGDYFGYALDFDGNTAIVGAWADDDGGDAGGSAYVFDYDGSTWTEGQKLFGSDAIAGDSFGQAIAVHGDWALVTATWGDGEFPNVGSVYAYHLDGSTWTEQYKLNSPTATSTQGFGDGLALGDMGALISESGNGTQMSAAGCGWAVADMADPVAVARWDEATVPRTFTLHPACPNPFNPATTLDVSLAAPGRLEVTVFNAAGRRVATLYEGMLGAGEHTVTFDGSRLPSGVYLVRARAGGERTQSRKVVLVK